MAVAEPMEREVEEVHCVDCGVPMPTIPGWYASVKVKFSCDNCRQKSPRLAALPSQADTTRRSAVVVGDTDADALPEEVEVDADAEAAEVVEEIEIDDADPVEIDEE